MSIASSRVVDVGSTRLAGVQFSSPTTPPATTLPPASPPSPFSGVDGGSTRATRMQFHPVTTLLCQLFPYPDVVCARGVERQPSFRKIFHLVQTLCMLVRFRASISANHTLGCQDITFICRMSSPSTAFHASVCRYRQLSLLSTRPGRQLHCLCTVSDSLPP